jgi:hypothetical protein
MKRKRIDVDIPLNPDGSCRTWEQIPEREREKMRRFSRSDLLTVSLEMKLEDRKRDDLKTTWNAIKVEDYEDAKEAQTAGLKEYDKKRKEDAAALAVKVQAYAEKMRGKKMVKVIVSDACEKFGISRSYYYDLLKR